jgi:hypothetical protein
MRWPNRWRNAMHPQTIMETKTTTELAHEACGYASHNEVCPLEIAQTLRAQAERDSESMDSVRKLLAVLKRLADAVVAHRESGISIATLNELCDAEDEARLALQAARW